MLRQRAVRFGTDRHGATVIEYALIAGCIALAIVGAAGTIGTNLITVFEAVSAGLTK